ncbi:MAG: MFS transporter [bacterium]|nr:MFS transporter [bacterium]
MEAVKTKHKKSIWGWVGYDMGNSVFSTTVMAGFFPLFFKSYWSQGTDAAMSTARLGLGVSLASLMVALAAPVLGSLSDAAGLKRPLLLSFALFGALMTALLAFIPAGGWAWAVLAYGAAVLGFYGGNVFYDALLPGLAPSGQRDGISGLGYAMGYLSGGLVFGLNVAMVQWPSSFGFSGTAEAVQASFLVAAACWAAAAWICYRLVPEPPARTGGPWAFKQSWAELARLWAELRCHRPVWMFLIAYWLYIDVVDTLVVMAVDYGMSLGFESGDLIKALLMVQLIGFPSAILVSKAGQKWGVRRAIFVCLAVYAFVCLWAVGLKEQWEFFLLAGLIGLVQGGVQALSRSYYADLIPAEKAGEFFGFYNMLGKFATILGPAMIALVGLSARALLPEGVGGAHLASRIGFASLLLPLLAGAYIFYRSQPVAET